MGLLLLPFGFGSGTLAFPDLYVEWSPTTNPGDTPVWERIPLADVSSVSTNRGRQRELDNFGAGTCSIVLRNEDRTYDPEYSAGAHFGNILPMRRIRVRSVYDNTHPVFDGYVEAWNQSYGNPNEATVDVRAVDGFKVLQAKTFSAGLWEAQVLANSPAHWWRLGEAAGSTTLVDSIGGVNATVLNTPTLGTTGLVVGDSDTSLTADGDTDGAETSGPPGVHGFPMTAVAIVSTTQSASGAALSLRDAAGSRIARLGVQGTGSGGEAFFVCRASDGTQETALSASSVCDGETHLLVGVWDENGTISVYVDGAASGTTATVTGAVNATNAVLLCGGGTISGGVVQGIVGVIDELVLFDRALSPAQIADMQVALTGADGDTSGERLERTLDLINWPDAERDIDTGVSTLQATAITGSVLAYAQNVEKTEAGLLFMDRDGKVHFVDRTSRNLEPYTVSQETFGDSGSELEYVEFAYDFEDQTIFNEVQVNRVGGVTAIASDADSIAKFVTRTLTLDGLLHDTDAASLGRAQYELARHKDPVLRITELVVEPQSDPAVLFPAVLALELGDRVTVNRRPQGVGDVISDDYFIEGIAHDVTPLRWRTTFYLSPTAANTLWVLGIDGASELGETTRLGF